ncbi:MAG: phosphotransferase [Nitrospirae bacterium]|nr:phosphotransferase [Nitrospirota bacterium]
MPDLKKEILEDYLSDLYKGDARISSISEIGKAETEELKGFGYGVPYLIRFSVNNMEKRIVLATMSPNSFGHDHFSDRAQNLLWDNSSYNHLPKHVRSVGVGAFTPEGNIISAGEAEEFFIVTEFAEGKGYNKDLERLLNTGKFEYTDEARAKALAEYLVSIHKVKMDAPHLYTRRIRDLIGHGECIMGLIDNYRTGYEFITEELLQKIEEGCVKWRWKIKGMAHRLCQVHGDFHPWNILFREGTDYTVLDRARGEWGEPADDVSTMAINYIFFSIQQHGRLEGVFERLFNVFWETYFDRSGDKEMLRVIQPFFIWRGLVIGSPLWYPTLPLDRRRKVFNFIENLLAEDEFKPERVNEYLG